MPIARPGGDGGARDHEAADALRRSEIACGRVLQPTQQMQPTQQIQPMQAEQPVAQPDAGQPAVSPESSTLDDPENEAGQLLTA